MFRRTNRGTTLVELLGSILVIGVACAVALPSAPIGADAGPIDDLGPETCRYFRLEFDQDVDPAAFSDELRRTLPRSAAPGNVNFAEVSWKRTRANELYVALWMLESDSIDVAETWFARLDAPPTRVDPVDDI